MKMKAKRRKQDDKHINYVVNEEKRTCTAYLEGVQDGMKNMVDKRLEHFGLSGFLFFPSSFDGKNFMDAVIADIPDKVVVTVRCSPEDEFNPETGCALARVRLLKKMYDYRYTVAARAMNRLTFTGVFFNELISICDDRIDNYDNEEHAILNSRKKSN